MEAQNKIKMQPFSSLNVTLTYTKTQTILSLIAPFTTKKPTAKSLLHTEMEYTASSVPENAPTRCSGQITFLLFALTT